MHLDFEITNDRPCFERLLKVSGIGERTVAKIHEYFERGTFDRIVEFKKDPQRVAMKVMMGIWGVGEKTVRPDFLS
jgi:Holliday junction resolvasome RuvABC DNA-binding subunit